MAEIASIRIGVRVVLQQPHHKGGTTASVDGNLPNTDKVPHAEKANIYRRNNEKGNDAYRQENLSVKPMRTLVTL